ncbi:chorismate-binding protein [Arcanobacterium haemolyticum]|nr:chorismate-binding protein [Arcanobacterium haemolyticum]
MNYARKTCSQGYRSLVVRAKCAVIVTGLPAGYSPQAQLTSYAHGVLELITRTVALSHELPGSVSDQPDPFALLDPSDPLLWWRGNSWMVGRGRILSLQFHGPQRFIEASQAWDELLRSSRVCDDGAADTRDETLEHDTSSACEILDDEVPHHALPLGLRAFSAFAFAGGSPASSVIVVPELMIGMTEGLLWATQVWHAGDPEPSPEDIAVAVRELIASTGEGVKAISKEAKATPSAAIASAAHTRDTAATASVTLANAENARPDHEEAVRRALDLIHTGMLDKVVLARKATANLPHTFSLPQVLRRLAATYPTCQVFSVDGFFGASPETLIESHSGRLHARVLAGTQPKPDISADPATCLLLGDAKELAEHTFAVNSVVDSLASFAASVHTDGPHVLDLPNVWHLATDVYAQLEGASLLALVDDLHPTAAVAGTPRAAALDAILSLESEDRGRYAGPVGWLGAHADGELAIGLRSAQIVGTRLEAWAGGGIVAGSKPEREFDETYAKLAPIRDALA